MSKKIKTLFLSTTDQVGGAARATNWLAKGLIRNGEDLSMLVQNKTGSDSWVFTKNSKTMNLLEGFRQPIDSIPLRVMYPKRHRTPWSLNWLPNPGLIENVAKFEPDIINLHWVGGGFVPINKLSRFEVPIVWSLYDMWPFTGGCHYDNFCDRFTGSCGNCPQLRSNGQDISRFIINSKKKYWAKKSLTIVAPSSWLAAEARRSSLFERQRIEVIPHGTDLKVFKPIDKNIAREILGLPNNAQFVLFGAMGGTSDTRKGFQYLGPALKMLSIKPEHKNLELMVFGAGAEKNNEELGFRVHFMGRLHDDVSLSVLYAAADVTVTPSMQEAFGMTASESMACGTPVVAFAASGPLDVIDHKKNGYLAKPYEIEDLANGISWVLSDKDRLKKLSVEARKKCEDFFELQHVAKLYSNLYQELISN